MLKISILNIKNKYVNIQICGCREHGGGGVQCNFKCFILKLVLQEVKLQENMEVGHIFSATFFFWYSFDVSLFDFLSIHPVCKAWCKLFPEGGKHKSTGWRIKIQGGNKVTSITSDRQIQQFKRFLSKHLSIRCFLMISWNGVLLTAKGNVKKGHW